MKILLDENLPRKLKQAFPGHLVATVAEMGWSGKNNGELLNLAEPIFEVLVTVDKNIQYQQNLTDRQLILVTLVVVYNKIQYLLPLIPRVLKQLQVATPGQIIQVEVS
jgi:predicted nuclease of predicted toxin-antitoxin system